MSDELLSVNEEGLRRIVKTMVEEFLREKASDSYFYVGVDRESGEAAKPVSEPPSRVGARFEIRNDDGDIYGIYGDLEMAKSYLWSFVRADPKNAADLFIIEYGEDGQRKEFVYTSNSKGVIHAAIFDEQDEDGLPSPDRLKKEIDYRIYSATGKRYGFVYVSPEEALDWIRKNQYIPKGTHLLVTEGVTTQTVVDEMIKS